MKRNIYIALILTMLAMLLCACAESSAETAATASAALDPDATPYVRLAPEEPERPTTAEPGAVQHESFWDMMDSFYEGHRGNFYFHGWELAEFDAQPQTAPYSFTLHQLPGADGDSLLSQYGDELMSLENRYRALESAALAGEVQPADAAIIELYPELCTLMGEDFISKMPEEWFALRQREAELAEKIMERRQQLDRDFAIASAREFLALGADAKVWACRSIFDGQEELSYICTVTISPEKLWELSEKTENKYFIEQLYESVRLRHDIPVELVEGE